MNPERLKKLQEKLKPENTYETPEKPYNPARNKDGTAYAVIKFLWNEDIDDNYYYELSTHTFTKNGIWYFNNCPSTIKEPCPVCDFNKKTWNSLEAKGGKDYARKEYSKATQMGIGTNGKATSTGKGTSFYSNVLIVEDPKNPENVGQVKVFRYGKKIYDKIANAIYPKLIEGLPEDHKNQPKAIDPFDITNNIVFVLRYKMVAGENNVDDCMFQEQDDFELSQKQINEILNKCQPLHKMVEREQFKSYEDLKARLEKVDPEIFGDHKKHQAKVEEFLDEEFNIDDESFV